MERKIHKIDASGQAVDELLLKLLLFYEENINLNFNLIWI